MWLEYEFSFSFGILLIFRGELFVSERFFFPFSFISNTATSQGVSRRLFWTPKVPEGGNFRANTTYWPPWLQTFRHTSLMGSEIPRPTTVWMVLKNPCKQWGCQLPTSTGKTFRISGSNSSGLHCTYVRTGQNSHWDLPMVGINSSTADCRGLYSHYKDSY